MQVDFNSPFFSAKLPTVLIRQTSLLPKVFTIQYIKQFAIVREDCHGFVYIWYYTNIHMHVNMIITVATSVKLLTSRILWLLWDLKDFVLTYASIFLGCNLPIHFLYCMLVIVNKCLSASTIEYITDWAIV